MSADARQTDCRHLILRCHEGDEEALGVLLEKYREWLKHVAAKELNRSVASRIDASDVVQQTFLSAIKNIRHFDCHNSAEFRTWLGRIHRCNIQDQLRRNVVAEKRSTISEEWVAQHALVDVHGSSPSRQLVLMERRQRVWDYVDELPEDQAQAVRLRHLEGWSLLQMAEHFDRSADSVASLLKRGLENLRRRIWDD